MHLLGHERDEVFEVARLPGARVSERHRFDADRVAQRSRLIRFDAREHAARQYGAQHF
jgi:hypothetical protein